MARRIVVVGGGFGGMYCARRLERRLLEGDAEIVLVNPENFMLYTPLLPEAAAGTIEPRHVVVPLRDALRRTRLLVGSVEQVDVGRRTCDVRLDSGEPRRLEWDRLVLAPGSVSRVLPIPGLTEHAHGFKTLAEGIYLRNHLLRQLELADASEDEAERRARLTVVVVGAGYAGVEVLAELRNLVVSAIRRFYPSLEGASRWLLVDVASHVLPELGGELSRTALGVLRDRGVDIRLRTTVEEAGPGWLRLSDGERVATGTFVWTAGVAPDPLVGKLGLPTDERGRLQVDEHLRARSAPDVFALGDAAAAPIAGEPGAIAPPTAQHALRQAKVCADNVAASLGHGGWRRSQFKGLGLLVNLAEHEGVARVRGIPLSGLAGWFVTRSYHWYALPSWPRRLRVGLDWAVAAAFPRDIAELGSLGHPRQLDANRPSAR